MGGKPMSRVGGGGLDCGLSVFLNPTILAFLAVAFVPAILHYLSRSRLESRVWGAMMFLPGGGGERGGAPREWTWLVLLALRTLGVGLLVVAMARPVMPSGALASWSLAPPVTGRGSLVLIMDTSGSTSASPVPGVTRLDAIKEAGARILASLPAEDVATILTCDGPPGAFTSDRQALQSRLADQRAGDRSLDVAQLLRRGAALLAERPSGRRMIAVVTDRQAVSYAGIDESFAAGWRESAKATGVDRVLISAVGDAQRDNVAVESIALPNPLVIRGKPTEIVVRLRNYGSLPRPGFPIRVATTALLDARATVDLPAQGEAEASVELTFPTAGRMAVMAECAASAGPDFDDRLWAVVDVGEGLRVLAMSADVAAPTTIPATMRSIGTSVAGPTTGPTGLAIAPFGERIADGAVVVATPPGRLPTYGLGDYDLVVIPELGRLSEADGRALVQYVYAGGGLLLGVGPETPEGSLAALQAILPATVGGASSAPTTRPTATAAMRYSGGVPMDGSTPCRELIPASTAEPLVLSGSEALVVEGRAGAGRVIVCAAPLEGAESALPRASSFVPFVRALARRFAASDERAMSSELGAPVEVPLRDAAEPRSLTLTGPDGQQVPITVDHLANRWVARCAGLDEPGLWRLRYRAGNRERVEPIAVRPGVGESDLAAADGAIAAAAGRLGAELLDTRQSLPLPELRPRLELWPHALALAAACLAVEQMIAGRRAAAIRHPWGGRGGRAGARGVGGRA